MVPVRTAAGAFVDQLLWWARVAKQGRTALPPPASWSWPPPARRDEGVDSDGDLNHCTIK